MIKTWKNPRTRRVFESGSSRGFRGLDTEKAENRLAALNVAKSLDDLGRLKSVGLHKLKGDRKGQWAMTINGPWRVCFRFYEGDAYDVEITDYHKG
jgi:proteic killer suppression protein